MIVAENNLTSVVPTQQVPTVVIQGQPSTVVTKVTETVSVVSLDPQYTVVARPIEPVVVPIQRPVTVVAGAEQKGPKIYFGPTPPLGAKLNDIWIRTA